MADDPLGVEVVVDAANQLGRGVDDDDIVALTSISGGRC